MTDRRIVGYNLTLNRLEVAQTGDRYWADQPVYFSNTVQMDGLVNGRDFSADGTKLDLITVTATADLDTIETKVALITVTQAVDLDAINGAVAGLSGAVVLMGVWDASTGLFPASTNAGETWIITGDGVVDGLSFNTNDRLLAIVDNANNSISAHWHKLDYTDAVLSVAGRVGSVTLTEADITDLQAYLLPTSIDTLSKLNAIVGESILISSAIDTLAKLNSIVSETLIDDTDSRLTDARAPTVHTHAIADLTDQGDFAQVGYAITNLPVGSVGQMARVIDGDALLAWGDQAINSGGGVTPYLVWYNGVYWTVVGK